MNTIDFIKRVKNTCIRRLKEYYKEYKIKHFQKIEKRLPIQEKVVVFDTAINSLNMGDYIIQHYCNLFINELFSDIKVERVQTHKYPNEQEVKAISGAAIKMVCGTNLITPHFEENSIWKMPDDLKGYFNIVTAGVGWGYYCDDISDYSKKIYKNILHATMLHSVRDSYTEKQFRKMGFNNVINTGCPTLWNLTSEHCALIPTQKASKVICTITDYDRDILQDRKMLNILLNHYDEVAVWIQGIDDQEYLETLIDTELITIVPRSLEEYSNYLSNGDLDYIGTRLHAGIHAMNYKVRSLIVAIDNRAIEMAKDVNLPIILRSDIDEKLEKMVLEKRSTNIKIPYDNINRWKRQFM